MPQINGGAVRVCRRRWHCQWRQSQSGAKAKAALGSASAHRKTTGTGGRPNWPGQSTVHRDKGGSCNLEDAKRRAEAGLPGTPSLTVFGNLRALLSSSLLTFLSWDAFVPGFRITLLLSLARFSSSVLFIPFPLSSLPLFPFFSFLAPILPFVLPTFLSLPPRPFPSRYFLSLFHPQPFVFLQYWHVARINAGHGASYRAALEEVYDRRRAAQKAQSQQEDIATTQLRQQARQLRQHGKLLEPFRSKCLLSSLA